MRVILGITSMTGTNNYDEDLSYREERKRSPDSVLA